MKYKSIAIPKPSEGKSFKDVPHITVPDQSMSLEEILQRFTRGEAVPVGQPVEYGSDIEDFLNVDLEKIANSDLTEKAEYISQLKEVKIAYERSEKLKAKKAHDLKIAEQTKLEERRIRIKAKHLAKQNSDKKA